MTRSPAHCAIRPLLKEPDGPFPCKSRARYATLNIHTAMPNDAHHKNPAPVATTAAFGECVAPPAPAVAVAGTDPTVVEAFLPSTDVTTGVVQFAPSSSPP